MKYKIGIDKITQVWYDSSMSKEVIEIIDKDKARVDEVDDTLVQRKTPRKRGKKFSKRTIVKKEAGTIANQWQATQRQQDWLEYYMNPKHKDTFGNSYQAALKAGYSASYAQDIMNPSTALEWVQQAKDLMRLNPEHLKYALSDIIGDTSEKTGDRIAAIKLLGTEQGMFVQRQAIGHFNLEDALNDLE